MKFTLSVVVATLLSLGMAAPAPQQRVSKETIASDRQALRDINGKPVNPNLPNGERILNNGQGSCFAVQGRARCQDAVGNSI
ncbi:hypothetical protein RB595_005150 [Gaeumannomyces hyphopodioides]